jgi:16S rRNA (uracil1498-N3)-methyltransferase
MPRFYLPPQAIQGNRFTLSGSEAHHATHVLRKKAGDEIDLFDGKDTSFRGRIDVVGPNRIEGTLVENLSPQALPVQLTLCQALTKGSKWEWLLEKACEIGVAKVVPLFTKRSLIKLDAVQAREKVKRWNRLSLAASKQSGRSQLMVVDEPRKLSEAIQTMDKNHLSLIPWEKEIDRTVHAACAGFHGSAVNIFIGPEGGWDAVEIQLALRSHILPVKLGPTLLRTETAGLVAATLVLREFSVF